LIEAVSAKNLDEVLPLVRAYMEFYHVAGIDDARNKDFFSQFGEGSEKGCSFLYLKEGKAVAFATVYFPYTTSITANGDATCGDDAFRLNNDYSNCLLFCVD